MEKDILVKVENVPTFYFVVSKNISIREIKRYFAKDYPSYSIRFFPNPNKEIKVFENEKYDHLNLESVWNKIDNGIFSLYKNKVFTGIKDLDIIILNNIDDKKLYKMMRTNKYFWNLTLNDNFWFHRIKKFYNIDVNYKPQNVTWRNYYQRMKKTLKIVIVGDTMCGKTSLVNILKNSPILGHNPTLGVEVDSLHKYNRFFNLWDCGGDERFTCLGDGYYVQAQGAIIFCDCTNLESIKSVEKYYVDLTRMGVNQIVTVANKCDLVSKENLEILSQRLPHILFISCLQNLNIDLIFQRL
jgi:small GTP-binding protein